MTSGTALPDRPDMVAATEVGTIRWAWSTRKTPQARRWNERCSGGASIPRSSTWKCPFWLHPRPHGGAVPSGTREVELTNVRAVVAQVERYRARHGIWKPWVDAHESAALTS